MFADGTQKKRIQMQRTYQGIVPGWFSPTRGGDMMARFNKWTAYRQATGQGVGGLDSRDAQILSWVNQGRYDISPDGTSLIDMWQPAGASVAPVSVKPITPPVVVRPPTNPGGGSSGTTPTPTPAGQLEGLPAINWPTPSGSTQQATPATPTPPAPTGSPVTTNKPGWKPGDWLY